LQASAWAPVLVVDVLEVKDAITCRREWPS